MLIVRKLSSAECGYSRCANDRLPKREPNIYLGLIPEILTRMLNIETLKLNLPNSQT